MLIPSLLIVAGLAALVLGGESVVRGAIGICRRFGVSRLVVGLLVVAFGTSVPELAVNLTASLQGQGELCYGNIIGSNIANIGLILGAAALVRPLAIASIVVRREIPMLAMVSVAAAALGFDRFMSAAAADHFSRGDAVVLLLLFSAFLYYTVMEVVRGKRVDSALATGPNGERAGARDGASGAAAGDRVDGVPSTAAPPPIWKAAGLTLLGFVLLTAGGKLTVDGAVDLAQLFGVSEALIGLTIVAIGTSLPELVTALTAVRHGEVNMAVGNVIGSNLFNLLFVLGISSLIQPVPIPAGTGSSLLMMLFLTLLLWPMILTNQRRVVRWEGALLLLLYFAHIAYQSLPVLR